jgi:hypothetical protein
MNSLKNLLGICRALLITCAATTLLSTTPAEALPIEATVGTGSNAANILVEFQDGNAFVFEVLFSGSEISGLDAITTIEASLPSFSLVLLDFGAFGFAVDGVTYGAHSNLGFGGGELFWHYWTKEAELDAWAFADVGVSFRQIQDGGWDGWKYEAQAPVPEPGTAVLVGIGLAGIGWSRTRQRQAPRQRSSVASVA